MLKSVEFEFIFVTILKKKKLHRPGFAWNIFLEVDIRNLAVVNFMKRFNTGFYFINYSFLNYLEL